MLLELMERESPMNIELMKAMTGLLVKKITPALHWFFLEFGWKYENSNT